MTLHLPTHEPPSPRVASSKPDRKTFKWDDASKALARDLLNAGCSFSAVAERIGVSRSAIAGISRRLGVSKPQSEVNFARKQAKEALKAEAKANSIKPPPAVLAPIVEPTDFTKHGSKPVALSDLRARHCRCVVGRNDREPLFCGETIVPGYSWCASHKAQFIVPSKYQETPKGLK